MTAVITHATTAVTADDGSEVGSDAWNENHTISDKGNLTRTDDTNVTLTLDGTPTGALLEDVSIKAGWTGLLASSRGGTGNGFFKVSGPATSEKTYTFPDEDSTVVTLDAEQTLSNKTLTSVVSATFGTLSSGVPDPALSIARSLTTGDSHSHCFVDGSTFNKAYSYNSYDARPKLVQLGSGGLDHYSAFQARPVYSASGTVARMTLYDGWVEITGGGTITEFHSFRAYKPTLTSGNITTFYGLYVPTVTDATTNWGVYVQGNDSFFGGRIGMSASPTSAINFYVHSNITGAVTFANILADGEIQSDVTSSVSYFEARPKTEAASFVLGSAYAFRVGTPVIGDGSTLNNLYGLYVGAAVAGKATNTYGVYSVMAAASNVWNFYAAGTARNYMAGALSIGATDDPGSGGLHVEGEIQSVGTLSIAKETAIPEGGTAGTGYKFSSTSNFGVFFGSGAPTLSAAQGSLYLRSDGDATNTRAYINTDGNATWTALTTAA